MVRPRTAFAWLIELASSQPSMPLYLQGGSADQAIGWTHDHNEAAAFATEAEGKAFAAKHVEADVRIREHGWG